MNALPDLLNQARQAGLTLVANGPDDLRVRGPREALDRLVPALRPHKPELLACLAELDRLLDRVAERYEWSPDDVAEARAGCSRDPLAHREMFISWLTETWPKELA